MLNIQGVSTNTIYFELAFAPSYGSHGCRSVGAFTWFSRELNVKMLYLTLLRLWTSRRAVDGSCLKHAVTFLRLRQPLAIFSSLRNFFSNFSVDKAASVSCIRPTHLRHTPPNCPNTIGLRILGARILLAATAARQKILLA